MTYLDTIRALETALLVFEEGLPLWFDGSCVVNHQDPPFRTPVAVLSDHSGQALALASLLVAGAAHREVGVAPAGLAPVGPKVPEPGLTPVALGPSGPGLALALSGQQVALARCGSLTAIAQEWSLSS